MTPAYLVCNGVRVVRFLDRNTAMLRVAFYQQFWPRDEWKVEVEDDR